MQNQTNLHHIRKKVEIVFRAKNRLFPIKFAEKLRKLPTPIIGRINDSTLVLDLRCLEKETDLIRQLQFLKNE